MREVFMYLDTLPWSNEEVWARSFFTNTLIMRSSKVRVWISEVLKPRGTLSLKKFPKVVSSSLEVQQEARPLTSSGLVKSGSKQVQMNSAVAQLWQMKFALHILDQWSPAAANWWRSWRGTWSPWHFKCLANPCLWCQSIFQVVFISKTFQQNADNAKWNMKGQLSHMQTKGWSMPVT